MTLQLSREFTQEIKLPSHRIPNLYDPTGSPLINRGNEIAAIPNKIINRPENREKISDSPGHSLQEDHTHALSQSRASHQKIADDETTFSLQEFPQITPPPIAHHPLTITTQQPNPISIKKHSFLSQNFDENTNGEADEMESEVVTLTAVAAVAQQIPCMKKKVNHLSQIHSTNISQQQQSEKLNQVQLGVAGTASTQQNHTINHSNIRNNSNQLISAATHYHHNSLQPLLFERESHQLSLTQSTAIFLVSQTQQQQMENKVEERDIEHSQLLQVEKQAQFTIEQHNLSLATVELKNQSIINRNKLPTMNQFNQKNDDKEQEEEEEDIIKPRATGLTIGLEKEEREVSDIPPAGTSTRGISSCKQISFMEAWARVKTLDLTKEKRMLQTIRKEIQIQSMSSASMMFRLFGRCAAATAAHIPVSSPLSSNLLQDKEQILALSQVPFDTSDSLHVSIINSVYCVLRTTDFCPVNGSHWISIGFNHTNLKYNFADAGIFGAVQMLAFAYCYREYMCDVLIEIETIDSLQEQQVHTNQAEVTQKNKKKSNKELKLSAMLQQISRQCLIWLEKGLFDGLIQAEKSVISVINKIYFATFFIFYESFKINNSGFLAASIAYKNTIQLVSANPTNALDLFKKQISYYYKHRQ